MTGQDFQDKLDAIVGDLQTTAKGRECKILVRGEDNDASIFTLSSDSGGVVNAAQLANLQGTLDTFKQIADEYEAQRGLYTPQLDAFKSAREAHQPLIDAAALANKNLRDALEADAAYQTAAAALEAARADPDYIAAVTGYKTYNVSENYGNLSEARGKYL